MNRFIDDLVKRYPDLSFLAETLEKTAMMICEAFSAGNRLYVCGNGGSAADADHIVGELMKGFILKREVKTSFCDELARLYGSEGESMGKRMQEGLPAISLTGHPSLSTAFANDVSPEMVFAQQIYALGRPGDVLVGITTSGNSLNVVNCLKVAKAKGLRTVAMTGRTGGKCAALVDGLINVPADLTFLVQEYHLPVYHTLCMIIEDHFYGGEK